MARVHDHGKFYRLPPDNRSLNYEKFFEEGKEISKEYDDYNSHNAERLNVQQIEKLLLNLDFIRDELKK